MMDAQVDIDSLKLQLMREFLEIQDRSLLKQLLDVVRTNRGEKRSKKSHHGYSIADGQPFGDDELRVLVEKIDFAKNEGRLTPIEEFEKEIDAW